MTSRHKSNDAKEVDILDRCGLPLNGGFNLGCYGKVVVIYTAAGTHPKQNNYSHGSRFPCKNFYIHGWRAFSIKVLFTW